MYDILQLNDMLVPELLDIAEQLDIDSPKKLDKQELIYKILDKQAVVGGGSNTAVAEKGRKKRIVKASTPNSIEEAIVEDTGSEEEVQEEKKPAKNARSGNGRIASTKELKFVSCWKANLFNSK
jgi:transcription termination factor Rho